MRHGFGYSRLYEPARARQERTEPLSCFAEFTLSEANGLSMTAGEGNTGRQLRVMLIVADQSAVSTINRLLRLSKLFVKVH
jgi:hypothetical protein